MKLLYYLSFIFIIILYCSSDQDKRTDTVMLNKNSRQHLPSEFRNILNLEFGSDNFPPGFEEHTGYVLGYNEGDEYVIDHVSKNNTQLLWLCKLTQRDIQGRPFLRILDIIILPAYNEKDQLLMGCCEFNGIADPEIITIARFHADNVKAEIRHAWRANRKRKQFEKIPLEKVTCINETLYL